MTTPPELHGFIIGGAIGTIARVGTLPIDAEWAAGTAVDGDRRWSQRRQAWFGRAYAVSWNIGDNVGVPTGPWPGLGGAMVQCTPVAGGTPWESYPANMSVPDAPRFEFSGAGSTLATAATSAGTGVIFIVQTAAGDPATSATPPAIDLDVLDYLGDAVLTNGTNVVEYAVDPGDGDDGDGFIDWPELNLYERGVGNPGLWYLWGCIANPPHQISLTGTSEWAPVIQGFAAEGASGADPVADADVLRLFAGIGIGYFPDAGFRVRPNGTTIITGDLPDDTVLANGQMALWFDPTDGAGKFMIKAKTADGTVVTGNVPLT